MEYDLNNKIKSFTQLITWQKAKDFTVDVYLVTKAFPQDELYSITSQIRRSANSVPANIAEGFARNTAKDKRHFYTMSNGSLTETLSHLYIAKDLGYITSEELSGFEIKATEIAKMINGMIKAAQTKGEV